ncbi:hypothetical protein DSCO28_33290 [Desulfosarcina ovata subsp. sediminis]|uniref:O-antigen polymerase n=1 Tax=Desulfosarcina ovata subsp. sediminis TaxID=885957 RepID=A0A5K7ZRT7_9BACT|nr:hypothetical protein DSCO28_33290 [Desulfosarcina ovata subsp. sediminis]
MALINLNLNKKQIVLINKFLFLLFIIQLPVVAYKFSIQGFAEENIGTYAIKGGGLTTMIPIVAIAYMMAWYFLVKRSNWYIILSVCFILWGIVGQKVALLFLFPITFFCLYYILIIRNSGFHFVRDISLSTTILLMSAVVVAAFIYTEPRLNRERTIGGKIDFNYAFNNASKYTTSELPTDARFGAGRTATTKLAIKQLVNDGFNNFVFGYGPGAMTPSVLNKSNRYDSRLWKISGSYGITGLVYIWIEYGVFAVFLFCVLFLLFLKESWYCYNIELDPYWKSFAAGSIIFCLLNLFIFLTYNINPVADDTLLPVFYYVMAVIHILPVKD